MLELDRERRLKKWAQVKINAENSILCCWEWWNERIGWLLAAASTGNQQHRSEAAEAVEKSLNLERVRGR